MKQELQKKLFTTYPALFTRQELGVYKSCMAWGIECGDGWYAILDSLCQLISHNKSTTFQFEQIKEKFATLRIYTVGESEKESGYVTMAEEWSTHVCEHCGTNQEVFVWRGGWIKTLCTPCGLKDGRAAADAVTNEEENGNSI